MLNFGFIGGGNTAPSGYVLNEPTNFAGVGSDEGGGVFAATLTWDAPVGNTALTATYTLYKDSVYIAAIPDGTLTYVDNDVLPDEGYTYTIKTRDVNGYNSDATSALSVAIPNLVLPTSPNMPTIAHRGIDSFTLSWVAPTEGSYSIAGYIIKENGKEVSRTSNLSTAVYFTARDRKYPTWSVQAIDSEGWLSSDSAGRTTDSTDGDINPLSDAVEWNYEGTNPENTRVFIGAVLQNATANVNDFYSYGGLDNEFNGVDLGDVEFSFTSELISNQCHTFPLAIKATNALNWMSMRIWGGEIQVYERINGVDAKLFVTPHSGNKNEKFTIKSVGQVITAYRYNTLLFTYTTTLTGGKVGIVQRSCPSGNNYLGSRYKLVTNTCDAEGTQLIDNHTFDCGTMKWTSDASYPATITGNGDGSVHLTADTDYGSLVPENRTFPDGSYNLTVDVRNMTGAGKASIRDNGGTWHSQTLVDGNNVFPYTGTISTINVGADNDASFVADFELIGLETV